MSLRRVDFVADTIEKHGLSDHAALGMGDSLGVAAIQGMQCYGEKFGRPFEAILLRDGWNLRASESKPRGIGYYLSYLVKDEIHKKRDHVSIDVHDYGFSGKEYAIEDETNPLQKMWNVADMMRSHINVLNAHRLARLAALSGWAMNVVCLRQGLSGSDREQVDFLKSLDTAYNEVRPLNSDIHTLRTTISDGWHSDLLDPIRGASDVEDTMKLLKQSQA
jgi:hypothetical protein